MRESDIIVRTGGDEFLLIMPNCSIETAKYDIEERLKQRLKEYKTSTGEKLPISSSCGFYNYNIEEELSVDELINRADQLMYKDKQESKILNGNNIDNLTRDKIYGQKWQKSAD
jgi:diguanylate cyclase (GGDEF)-like protein